MAATPDGKGYWLVAADGGIFSFGDAGFYGSTGSITLNEPIVGMAATPDGKGYWLVAADGGIFTFGDAGFYGSAGSENLPDPVVGMVASPDGGGYPMATANGVVLPFGDAKAFGGLTLEPDGHADLGHHRQQPGTGYWLLDPQAWKYSFATTDARGELLPGQPPSCGGGLTDRARSRHRALLQPLRARARSGARCSPPGPGSRPVSPSRRYGFTGDMYDWAARTGAVLPPTATPPRRRRALRHRAPEHARRRCMSAIVTQVWPDGAIITVDGDSGPGRDGWLSVTLDGPFLPADSQLVQRRAHLRLRSAVGGADAALGCGPGGLRPCRLRIPLLDLRGRLRRPPRPWPRPTRRPPVPTGTWAPGACSPSSPPPAWPPSRPVGCAALPSPAAAAAAAPAAERTAA